MVTLNARKSNRLSNSRGDVSSAAPSAAYPMQVRVARQVHTAGDADIDISHQWSQVRGQDILPANGD